MILIDSSTGSRDLVKYPPLDRPTFASLTSLSVSSDTKSSADVCFSGNGPDGKLSIGMEFKSLSDLLSSLYNGRIQTTQVGALVAEYQVCYLVTYGEYRCSPEGHLEIPDVRSFTKCDEIKDRLGNKIKKFYWFVRGIPYQGPFESREQAIADYRTNSRRWVPYTFIGGKPMVFGYLESALLSLSRAGIQHKHFTRIEDCAQWIGCCYRSWSKPWDEHKLFRTFDKSSDIRQRAIPGLDTNTKLKMSIAKELPGIGYERALEAARHFDTARDMLNADISDWLKVPGIGKTLAKAIVAAVSAGKQKPNAKPVDQTDGPNLSLFD